jgi:hypothetical protein
LSLSYAAGGRISFGNGYIERFRAYSGRDQQGLLCHVLCDTGPGGPKKSTGIKHSGAISFFDKEFVKTGIVDKRFSKWLHRLFDLRQDADYGSMFEPAENQCDQAMAHAKEFVQQIRKYLDNCIR